MAGCAGLTAPLLPRYPARGRSGCPGRPRSGPAAGKWPRPPLAGAEPPQGSGAVRGKWRPPSGSCMWVRGAGGGLVRGCLGLRGSCGGIGGVSALTRCRPQGGWRRRWTRRCCTPPSSPSATSPTSRSRWTTRPVRAGARGGGVPQAGRPPPERSVSAEKHRGFAFVEFELAEVRGEGAAEPGSCPPPAGSGAGCCCHGRPGGPLCPLQLPGFPWAEARSLPVGFCLVGTPRCCSFAVP